MAKIKEMEAWGRATARERYGSPNEGSMKAPDQCEPQAPEDKPGPKYENRTPDNWLRGAGENATTKPGFDKSKARRA